MRQDRVFQELGWYETHHRLFDSSGLFPKFPVVILVTVCPFGTRNGESWPQNALVGGISNATDAVSHARPDVKLLQV